MVAITRGNGLLLRVGRHPLICRDAEVAIPKPLATKRDLSRVGGRSYWLNARDTNDLPVLSQGRCPTARCSAIQLNACTCMLRGKRLTSIGVSNSRASGWPSKS